MYKYKDNATKEI